MPYVQGWKCPFRAGELTRANSGSNPLPFGMAKQFSIKERCKNWKPEEILSNFCIVKQQKNRAFGAKGNRKPKTYVHIFQPKKIKVEATLYPERDKWSAEQRCSSSTVCLYSSDYHTNKILICNAHKKVKDKSFVEAHSMWHGCMDLVQ